MSTLSVILDKHAPLKIETVCTKLFSAWLTPVVDQIFTTSFSNKIQKLHVRLLPKTHLSSANTDPEKPHTFVISFLHLLMKNLEKSRKTAGR